MSDCQTAPELLSLASTMVSELHSTIASAPFDSPRVDIILRTSDDVDFRVIKVILDLASPIFMDMFSLPQPPVKADDVVQTPVIPISESSAVLDIVLRFCYPIEPSSLDNSDVSLIGDVLAAALKYDISVVIGPAKRALRARAQTSNEDAVAAYAIACHLKQEDEARAAAVACLRWPSPGPKVPQLALMSGLDHYNLLDFHRRASAQVVSILTTYEFATETCAKIIANEHYCAGSKVWTYSFEDGKKEIREYQWWASTKAILSDAFKVAPLDLAKVSMSTLAPALLATTCNICREKALHGWGEARSDIIAVIKAKIDDVELELSWK